MANIGDRATLKVVRENQHGAYLDAGALGEVLLPGREVPPGTEPGTAIDVFLYTDSEDRPVATTARPKTMPGDFAKLRCVDVNQAGAFLDWGLSKDLFVPFREQKTRMEAGKSYLVHVHVDPASSRIIASTRITRWIDQMKSGFRGGEKVELIIFAKTELGYKAIVNQTFSGLLYHSQVFQPLQTGERLNGYISEVRPDGKLDLTLQPPGRDRVENLEETILAELRARGGSWAIGDFFPAAEIHDELGVSKRTFKQSIGALLKKKQITITDRGIKLADS
ncbi:MAG: S1-like domain-containing RNA-binding protein [Verrucomicrobiota bacterium]